MNRLGDLLLDIKPGFASRDDLAQGTFQFRMHNFTREGTLDLSRRRRVNASPRQLSTQSVLEGDVLFNATNSPELVGKSALIRGLDEPTVFSNHFFRLRADPSRLEPGYLAHRLRWEFGRGTFRAMAKTWVNQASVGRDRLEDLPIPLPPLPKQRRIAEILDQADAMRAKRRKTLEHLDSLTQAVFHEMFAGVGASTTVAAQASLVRTGPFGSQLRHGEFVDEGIAVLGLDNVVGNQFRWGERRYISAAKYEQLKRYTVAPGDVLISIMGTVGRCVVVPGDIPTAINTKHICAITPNRTALNSLFLRASFLWHPESRAHLRRQTKGSIMDGLNMGIIKAMPIPLPPLERQQEFAARVAAVAAKHATAKQALAANDELFDSLQSRAFRGEL